MAVTYVDLNDRYIPTSDTDDILVDVLIGDGQEGAYVIFSGGTLISTNEEANLGTAADIDGRDTIISVTIVDELEETNWTSITVIVTEDDKTTTFGPYKKQAEQHLDTIIYTLKISHH